MSRLGVGAVCALLCVAGCSLFVGDDDDGDPPPVAANCGSMAGLQDDFEDAEIDPQWDVFMSGSSFIREPRIDNGVLELGWNGITTSEGPQDAGLVSTLSFSMENHVLSVRVVDWPEGGHSVNLGLEDPHTGARVRIGLVEDSDGQHLRATTSVGTMESPLATRAYDPATDQYLVMRGGTDGAVELLASEDPLGKDVTPLTTYTTPFELAHVRARLRLGASSAVGFDGTITLDDFNTASDLVDACPMSGLDEDFRDEPDARWRLVSDFMGDVFWGDGEAVLFSQGTPVEIRSASGYDLRGGQLVVELGALPDGPSNTTALGLEDAAGNVLLIQQTVNGIELGQIVAGEPVLTPAAPYDPAGAHTWTVSEAGGEVELSAESQSGDVRQFAVMTTVDTSRVSVHVASRNSGEVKAVVTSIRGTP